MARYMEDTLIKDKDQTYHVNGGAEAIDGWLHEKWETTAQYRLCYPLTYNKERCKSNTPR